MCVFSGTTSVSKNELKVLYKYDQIQCYIHDLLYRISLSFWPSKLFVNFSRVSNSEKNFPYFPYVYNGMLSQCCVWIPLHSKQNTMTIHYSFLILTWVRPSLFFILTYWVCFDILVSRYHLQWPES